MAFNGDNFLNKSGLDALWTKIKGKFLPLSGGQMTGPLSWKNGTALPGKTSGINYLLTIDSFADGGKTYYASMANVASAIAPTVESAIEDDYAMLTRKDVYSIPSGSDLDTYKTPGVYVCGQNTTAASLINSPITVAFALVVLVTVYPPSGTPTGIKQIIYRYQSASATAESENSPQTWERHFYSSWKPWIKTSAVLSNPRSGNRPTDINFAPGENGFGTLFRLIAESTATGAPRNNANVLQLNWDGNTGYDSQLALAYHGRWLGFRSQSGGAWTPWSYAQTLNFGTCSTAADVAAKTVTIGNALNATTGVEVTILFTNGNQATSPTLTINLPVNTKADGTTTSGGTCGSNLPIYYQGRPVDPGYIKAGDVVRMAYYSSKWYIVGSINSVTSYANHILYYIDAANGNDSNDGLTKNTAFQTLDKFFDVTANSGYTDVRCLLCSAGDYVLTKQAANNITWHCRIHPEVTAGPVRLVGNYGVAEDWIMYNSHVKLSGLVAGDEVSGVTVANTIPLIYEPLSPNDQGIYFENSAVTLYNVEFRCIFRLFGCYLNASGGLKAERLYFAGVNGILEDLAITNTVNDRRAVRILRGSSLRISSPGNSSRELTVAELSATGTEEASVFLDVRDSEVILTSKMPSKTNRYKYGLQAVNSTITGRRTYIATFVSRCAAVTILADEDSVFNCNFSNAGFTSGNGVEYIDHTFTVSSISAGGSKATTLAAATLQPLVNANSTGDSATTYLYRIVSVLPGSLENNNVHWAKFTNTETTATITIANHGKSTISSVSVTVRILYEMKPFSITKAS